MAHTHSFAPLSSPRTQRLLAELGLQPIQLMKGDGNRDHSMSTDSVQAEDTKASNSSPQEDPPHPCAALIYELGTKLFTHDQERLYAHAKAMVTSGNVQARIQDYE